MEKEIKTEVTDEISLDSIINSTSDGAHVNLTLKEEFVVCESHSYSELMLKHAAVKHEDISIQSLDLQVKSEVPELQCGNDDIDIKLGQLTSEELHIKDEVEESLVDRTINNSTQVKHFYCGLCNSKFELKNSVQKHLKAHTGKKPFQCNICNYRSIRNSNLQSHMKTHTGERPFKCTVCDYKSIGKNDLKRHFKRHTGEKPFHCNACDYKCIEKCALNLHNKTHTGEKTFHCTLCDYKCVRKNDLERHKKYIREKNLFSAIYVFINVYKRVLCYYT